MDLNRVLRNYISGQWVEAENSGFLNVENPSTGEVLTQVPLSTASELNRAVSSAKTAFWEWSRMPVAQRCELLSNLTNKIYDNREEIARLISKEMGKSLPDARAEVKRVIENCQVANSMHSLIQGDILTDVSPGIDGEVIRTPIGVFGAITPFNFPAMVPFWFLPYALTTGNTFIVKPSERTPMTMQMIFEMIDSCGFPPGVVNLVNGDKQVAQAMLEHPDITGISFVGTSEVCRIVAETCSRTGKRFQAFGSAKNYLVIMPDAKMDEAVRNMLTSCLGCAGQRCMAASVIACVGDDVYKKIVADVVTTAKMVKVGNPLDPELTNEALVIGPVISARAKERIEHLIRVGIDEGAKLALDGRGIKVKGGEKGHFLGPTILVDAKPGMTVEKTEIFGPVIIMMKFNSLDEVIQAINNHRYGNGASIYTQNGYYARKFKLETKVGMIGINIGIPAPVAYLPFGGTKDSLYADIKTQGKDIINFFTERKIITERYWPEQ